MEVTLLDWPESTPLFAHNSIVRKYIEDLSTRTGVHRDTIYGARVQRVKKDGSGWEVTWIMLQKKSTKIEHTAVRAIKSRQFPFIFADQMMLKYFDAVVLATGHYHAPRVPNIPGLSQAKKRCSTRVMHSKEYRVPDAFKDKVSASYSSLKMEHATDADRLSVESSLNRRRRIVIRHCQRHMPTGRYHLPEHQEQSFRSRP